jgi:hypothetical protein
MLVWQKTLSSKPDWSTSKAYKVSLSGVVVQFILPGKLSVDYPSVEAENRNLYDDALYGKWKSFILADSYWDDKYKKLIFSEMLDTLNMKLSVQQKPKAIISQLNNMKTLRESVEEVIERTYSEKERAVRDFETKNINNMQWLKYMLPGGVNNIDSTHYAITMTTISISHFI